MCSKEIDAQLDASLDEKLMEFRPGVHDTSVLLYAVQVSMTWLADAVSAKNIRNPGEHVFGAFNAITKIANGFILNIRAAEFIIATKPDAQATGAGNARRGRCCQCRALGLARRDALSVRSLRN